MYVWFISPDWTLVTDTIIIVFIPGAGEAAGTAGLTAVRSLLRLIGVAGDIALTVYDVVQNPDNAFLAVFLYLAGAGVGKGGFKSAAQARRGMTTKEYTSLGPVKTRLDSVVNIRGNTCKIWRLRWDCLTFRVFYWNQSLRSKKSVVNFLA